MSPVYCYHRQFRSSLSCLRPIYGNPQWKRPRTGTGCRCKQALGIPLSSALDVVATVFVLFAGPFVFYVMHKDHDVRFREEINSECTTSAASSSAATSAASSSAALGSNLAVVSQVQDPRGRMQYGDVVVTHWDKCLAISKSDFRKTYLLAKAAGCCTLQLLEPAELERVKDLDFVLEWVSGLK